MQTRLDPWCVRLLAIVAAAPLLHCGGSTSGDDDGGGGTTSSGGTTASGGTTSSGGSAGKGGSVGTGGTVSTGGSGGSAGKGGSGGTAGSGGFPCENPTPVGVDSGYENCDGGFRHRKEAKECASSLPRTPDWEAIDGDTCGSDADCTEKPHGYCDIIGAPSLNRGCHYGCTVDADCGDGAICVCGSFIGTCKPASCTSDADCGDGLLCASHTNTICIDGGYACQNPADECVSNADCPTTRCALEEDGVRRCSIDGCAQVGRPFLVEEQARLAEPAARCDWKDGALALDSGGSSAAERKALGAAWLENALMEHASVAAFARFTLELLAVGAPADLIRDSNAAASDETRHAELCFALASEYLGEPVGPGPLKVEGALDGVSLEKLVVTAIAEGCVGETVAAVEAAEQLAQARDATVRGVLARISEDETRHAELAWRFVTWAIERDPSLRAVAEREFERHLSAPRVLGERGGLDLARHGVLSERARSEVRSAVLDGVIRDAASALLAEPQRARPSGKEAPTAV